MLPNITITLFPLQIFLTKNNLALPLCIQKKREKKEGKKKDKVSFIAEVSYAGIFTLNQVPAEHEKPLLLIEAPRMLFPFARYILAEVTRDGGYPPLMLNPIDFAALYRKQMEEKKKKN